eukprot:961114-Pyramimonas_sp.AAC.2
MCVGLWAFVLDRPPPWREDNRVSRSAVLASFVALPRGAEGLEGAKMIVLLGSTRAREDDHNMFLFKLHDWSATWSHAGSEWSTIKCHQAFELGAMRAATRGGVMILRGRSFRAFIA